MTAGAIPRSETSRRGIQKVSLGLLALASVAALITGSVVSAKEKEPVIPVPTGTPSSDPVAQVCAPPVAPAESEPWLAGDGSAERTWQEHAAEVGLPYLVGPNGWVFWSDYIEQYASQAVGRTTLSRAELSRWVDYYASVRDGLAAEGIEFYIIVTPSTSSIYPEELPAWMQPLRGSTIMDQFMSVAQGLPVIDMRADLIDAKTDDVNLFSWSNSHWTDYGAYVGWQQIAECVNAMYPDGDPLRVPAVSGHQVIGDFNEWATYGVPSPGADWAAPVFAEPLQDVTVTGADGTVETVDGSTVMDAGALPLSTSVEDPWTGKSALILRDSMGGGLSPYWDQAYSPTWQIGHPWTTYADWPRYRDLAAQYQPDVVVLQLAERHLVNAPPPGASY